MPRTVHVRRSSESIGPRGLPLTWKRESQSGRRAAQARCTMASGSPTSFTSCGSPFLVSSPGHRSFHVSPVMSTCRLQVRRSCPLRMPRRYASRNTSALTVAPSFAWKLAQMAALVFGQVLTPLALAVVRVRQRRHEPALLLAERVRAAEHGHEAVAARAAEWTHPLGLAGAPRERSLVREHALARRPRGAGLPPAPADGVEVVAAPVHGAGGAEHGPPRLDASTRTAASENHDVRRRSRRSVATCWRASRFFSSCWRCSVPASRAPCRWCRCRASDRKSTRLNSSHTVISYAVFCLKKKKR